MQVRLGHVSEIIASGLGEPTSEFLPNRYTCHIGTWPILKGLESRLRQTCKFVLGMCLNIWASGLGHQLVYFYQTATPFILRPGLSERAWKVALGVHIKSFEACVWPSQSVALEGQLANPYQTATPVILKPVPSERARKITLGRYTNSAWACVRAWLGGTN
jgi:hypothetical protein